MPCDADEKFRAVADAYDENRRNHVEIMDRLRGEGLSDLDAATGLAHAVMESFILEEVAFMYALAAGEASRARVILH